MGNEDQKQEKDYKQMNIRLRQDTMDAFRDFCALNGMNQAQGFEHIMQVVELNHAKAVVPGRAVEIEEFERHTKELLSAYLNSIELSQNTELRVAERFKLDMQRNQQTVNEVREQNASLKNELQHYKDLTAALQKENSDLQSKLVYSDKALTEQRQSMELLQSQATQMKEQLEAYDQLADEVQTLRKEKTELNARVNTASLQIDAMTANLAESKTAKELAESKLIEAQHECIGYRQQLSDSLQQQADLERQLKEMEYTSKAELKQAAVQAELEKERAVAAKEAELRETVSAAEKEKMRLSVELEYLRQNGTQTNR